MENNHGKKFFQKISIDDNFMIKVEQKVVNKTNMEENIKTLFDS